MNEVKSVEITAFWRRIQWIWLFGASCGLLLATGCSSSRKARTVEVKEKSPGFLVRQILENQISPEWMDARAKINFDDGYVSMGATANIRLQKDKVLWIAVKKLGFEVGRAMITPDSIYVLNRLKNEAIVKDINYISKQYNIPADFQMIQSLVLGNPLFFMTRGFKSGISEQRYHLYGARDGIESSYWLGGGDYQLEKMSFDDRKKGRQLQMDLSAYEPAAKNQNFSYLRNLKVDSQQTGKVSIDINFSQVEFNVPKSIRFEIPDRYKRVD